jgi:hypothetical protein
MVINKLKNNKNIFVFYTVIFLVFSSLYYSDFLNSGPVNNHMWRQTDCLSLTRNYAEGASFFEPEMDLLLAKNFKSGKTAGEFPIIYYTIGKLWKWFGESYLTYRLSYLILLYIGLLYFLKSLIIIFKNPIWALFFTFLMFTAPVLVVYGVSFLTDAPAFCFSLIALYHFIRYTQFHKQKHLVFSMLFFSLVGLLKISNLISFVFIVCIFFIELLKIPTIDNRFVFKKNITEFSLIASVIVVNFLWYNYAEKYNSIYQFKYTFNSIHPFWLMKSDEIQNLFTDLFNFPLVVFFSKTVLIVSFLAFIINLFLYKKIPLFAYFANIIITIGCIIYFLLWMPLMGVHDYYYIALLIWIPSTLIPLTYYLINYRPQIFNNKYTFLLMLLFLTYNLTYAYNVVDLRKTQQNGKKLIIGNKHFVDFMKWTNWDFNNKWQKYIDVKENLKQLGVNRNDRFISLNDNSLNTSLFLMNVRGWTNYLNYSKKEDILELIERGKANYLIFEDENLKNAEFLKDFLNQPVGEFNGLFLYKL